MWLNTRAWTSLTTPTTHTSQKTLYILISAFFVTFPLSFASNIYLTPLHHPPPSVTPQPLLSASVSPSSSRCLLSLPHVYFIGPLRRLGINKLCISLCARSEAPFRNGTDLVCWRARVYPKWLHQTRSQVSGSPDRPRSFVTAPGPSSHTDLQPARILCWNSSPTMFPGTYAASRQGKTCGGDPALGWRCKLMNACQDLLELTAAMFV